MSSHSNPLSTKPVGERNLPLGTVPIYNNAHLVVVSCGMHFTPFIKVVKFTAPFGQYGFRGQAVLFAQNIFEVSEKSHYMLLRSSSQVGIVVVIEGLENSNITREFTISREKVYSALR